MGSAPIGDLAWLARDLDERAFHAPSPLLGSTRIGAEVELLPIDLATHHIATVDADAPVSTLRVLRDHGTPLLWEEEVSSHGVSTFQLPDFGTITFEPGGQIEYSAPPCASASELLRRLRAVVLPLSTAARDAGIEMLAAGIDPYNRVEDAPLQLFTERYCQMADYFDRLGSSGARMMRQTGAMQVSLDLGERPLPRWRVLNAAAPYVSAIFANAPIYAGLPSRYASHRAHIWRTIDASRTGLPFGDGAPVASYLEFALCAPDLLRRTPDGEYLPFVGWIARGAATVQQWRAHLTTLFPEIRPRGYFEVRSADAVPPDCYAAPLALLSGITYDARALAEADELLGDPDLATLQLAAERGLQDPAIASRSVDLAEIALRGCARLGERFFHPADLAEARAFFDRYTRHGRTPADDLFLALHPLAR